MINTATLFIFTVFFVLINVFLSTRKSKRLKNETKSLPGPPALPLLGNFITMAKLSHVPYR